MTDRSKALVFRLNDHGQGPEIIRQMFLERGWVEFDEDEQDDDDWNIWWRTSRFRNCDYDFLQPWQRLNHYPKSVGITKKDCLARNLKRMKGVHGTGVYNFSPIAFNLPNDYTRYVAEYGRMKQQQNDGKQLLWICKPADMSRGRGIFIFKDISDLQYDCNAVVQRYISNPMLIGGYKFDLRIYVTVPCFHPLTIYVYEEGIVRFSTEKYDVNSLTNVFAHLTNTSINKHSPSYSTDKEYIGPGCKWTLTQLRHYFHQNNINDSVLWIRILNIVILTTLIQAPQVPKSSNCFELYGFDILIDENLKPWLLEVNFSPSLNADTQVDMLVKKPLLHDIIQMMNFKDSDVLRGGEKLRRQSSRVKKSDPIDRYASSSRLSHRSGVQRGTSFHKNLTTLSKHSTLEEKQSLPYIEQDSDDKSSKLKSNECLGLPLVSTKDDSRPNSASSGVSSSHSINENLVSKTQKNVIKRSKSADTRMNYDSQSGPKEKVKFYIGNPDDNNNISRANSSGLVNKIPRSAVTRESSSRYPRTERQTTSSSFARSDGSSTGRQEKGSIKSSATSDSAISSFSGSSENSDLVSLPNDSKRYPSRMLSQRQKLETIDVNKVINNEEKSIETVETSQTFKIKSLRPNGNSSTFRKISALGVSTNSNSQSMSSMPQRSRSRMQPNEGKVSSSLTNLPSYNRSQNSIVPKMSPKQQGSIPRNISRNNPNSNMSRFNNNNSNRFTARQNGRLSRSDLFVSNSPTHMQPGKAQGNVREVGQRNTNPSRLSIRRDSVKQIGTRSRVKGPAPTIGDFFLCFPFSEMSLKTANSTLDPHVVVKETQRLLKEALLKVDKVSGDKRMSGHLPLGAMEWERRLWGPIKPQEDNS